MVRFGNIYYFLFLIIGILFIIAGIFFLRKKDERFSYRFILTILFINFSLHFLKQLIPPYINQPFPQILRKSTLENICAVSTVIFPFIFMLKNNYLKDYMVYIGIISGAVAFFVPTEALAYDTINLDVIRFYVCHLSLIACPIFMIYKRIHRLNYRRILMVPVVFLGILTIIFLNELLLKGIGFIDSSWDSFFSPNERNSSWIFGIGDDFKAIKPFIMWMVPKFLYIHNGKEFFIPIIWMIIPLFILVEFWCIIFSLPFEYKHFIQDIKHIKREK